MFSQKPESGLEAGNSPGWISDMFKGLFYALLIILSILFFSGAASRFIYVDF